MNNCAENPACLRIGERLIGGVLYYVYRCGADDQIEMYPAEESSAAPPPEQDPLSFRRQD